MKLIKDYKLADETTLKIGGPAEFFLSVEKREELEGAVLQAQDLGLEVTILGGGSNVLVSSEGVPGLVVKLRSGEIEFLDDDLIRADAGVSLPRLSGFALKNSFEGLEWAMGVPGTVGGAVYGNAGAFGFSMADLIEEIEIIENKKKKVLKIEEIDFSYRNSTFKRMGAVIISTSLRLKKGKIEEIKRKTEEMLAHRNEKHPMKYPSAGSVFKNPVGKIESSEIIEKHPLVEKFNQQEIIPAGFLIQSVGMKGFSVGGAKISEKHANFIVNEGAATSEDVKSLIDKATEEVMSEFNIKLEREIRYINIK